MTDRLIIGCGYLGRRVATKWLSQGDRVFAITRRDENARALKELGVEPLVGDIMFPEQLPELPKVEQVLYAVGYDRQAGFSIEDVYVQGLKNLAARLGRSLQRLIYISSTGVYGQDDGSWVNEDSVTNPLRPGGKACLQAEQYLLASPLATKVTILRLAGIYGPDRVPRLTEIKAGEPLAVPQQGWLNLIHVDDAVSVIDTILQQPPLKTCYLVSDGCPVIRSEYLATIASLLNAPPIRYTQPATDSPVAQRAVGTKRISNQRLVSEYDIPWQFPTYREGLASVLKNARD